MGNTNCCLLNEKEEYCLDDKTFSNTKIFNLIDKELHAKVVDIYDGDTCTCIIYIFGDYYKFKIRLAEIDTCEMTSTNDKLKKKSIQAKNKLFNLITGQCINLNTEMSKNDMKDKLNNNETYIVKIICGDFDKYGRLLAWIYDKNHTVCEYKKEDKVKSFNHILVNEKLAYFYYGKTKMTEQEQIEKLLN
jgi:endonuclease YncB( thermonuclease family)